MKALSALWAAVLLLLLTACGGGSQSGLHTHPVTGRGLEKTRPDPLGERRIAMTNPESGEQLDVIYYHDGQYDQAALDRIDYLFRDRHANVTAPIDPELIDYLVDIRTRLGLPPNVVFQILNGYRTVETNVLLSQQNKNVAIESLHMHGWAVDFRIAYVDGCAIAEIAKTMQRGGVACYPKTNHVHVDLGNIRTWQEK